MVTSEIYDISPDLSAVGLLLGAGIDVWLVDFGAPERAPGGMERTLDDHVKAIDRAIDEIRSRTGRDVHLAGYSQGGMFCYEVAALRRGRGVRSIITFGSPVDLRRNLPGLGAGAAEWLLATARRAVERPLQRIEGLPGRLTSTAFKLVSVRKEIRQLIEFLQNLHDRSALERRESRRRFLRGEGFVAWPGPAFRKFVDEILVHNRLASGGLVIDGQTVSLADIACPILYFVGETDEIARPPSVRAIREAAPAAEIHEIAIRAGHFGLVVGSKAVTQTWPAVIDWVRWRDGAAEKPRSLTREKASTASDLDDGDLDDVPIDIDAFYDVASSAIEAISSRLEELGKEVGDRLDSLRWQIPRLQTLRQIEPHTPISMARALADQARAIPDRTFFLWKGRAFTYREADRRVDHAVRRLLQSGIRKGSKVGVLMGSRPSYLSIVCALNRMGAVAVLLRADSSRITLEQANRMVLMEAIVTDPEHASQARAAFPGPVLVLGGDRQRPSLPEGVVDLEVIDPDAVVLPRWYEPNQGRAADLAMILFTAGRNEVPRPARITNRRWAFSAFGTAASCTLSPSDTVYCCLPLHHAAGMLVAVGGALVGGSRLALAPRFDPETFWPEVRRYGASVAFYAGDMLRGLVDAQVSSLDAHPPIRLFAGSGMRTDVWERLVHRYGRASVLEFYASTEGHAVLANASGAKIGALGRPLPGSAELALVAWDFERERFARDESGRLRLSGTDEPGVLIARIDPAHPMASFDAAADHREETSRILRNVFETGDAWYVTGDLMRRDAEGDYWFVDRLGDVVRTALGPIPTIAVEDELCRIPAIRQAAVYGVAVPGASSQLLVAAVVLRDPSLDPLLLSHEIVAALPAPRRPRFLRIVDTLPLTDGFRLLKAALREEGVRPGEGTMTLAYDASSERYVPLDASTWERTIAEVRHPRPSARRPAARRR
jgi:putative long chain acyl-CoA synthase